MAQNISFSSDEIADAINRLVNLHKVYISKKNNVSQMYKEQYSQTLTDKDVRVMTFSSLSTRIELYLIAHNLEKEGLFKNGLPVSTMLSQINVRIIDDTQREHIIQSYIGDYLTWIKFSFFIHCFIDLEVNIRTLSSELSINEENIGKNITELIKKTEIDDGKDEEESHIRLWNILAYTRNTIHNGGFHRKNDCILKYKGKEFHFLKDKILTFLTPENICFLLAETAEMMGNFFISQRVVDLKKDILHVYSDITFS